jgi:hypothetical protein
LGTRFGIVRVRPASATNSVTLPSTLVLRPTLALPYFCTPSPLGHTTL